MLLSPSSSSIGVCVFLSHLTSDETGRAAEAHSQSIFASTLDRRGRCDNNRGESKSAAGWGLNVYYIDIRWSDDDSQVVSIKLGGSAMLLLVAPGLVVTGPGNCKILVCGE